MALSQAAYKAEQALGHGDNAETAQDVLVKHALKILATVLIVVQNQPRQ